MRLLTASPVNVSDWVWDAAKRPMCHREPAFGHVLRDVKRRLLDIAYGGGGRCAILNGNGTMAVESALQTFVDGRCLVLANGTYAHRVSASLQRLGCKVAELHNTKNLYAAYSLEHLDDALHKHTFDWVCVVHNESSIGRVNPLADVCGMAEACGARVFVDAVSSFGAYEIDKRASVVATCGNKCLESLCGCGIIMWRRGVRQASRSVSAVLNATNYASDVPNTANVPAILGLQAALGYGLWDEHQPRQPKNVFYEALARAMRDNVGKHFPLVLHDGWANNITAFRATAKQWTKYTRACARAGFRIYNYTEDGISFGRICNMGHGISNDDMLHLGEIAKKCA